MSLIQAIQLAEISLVAQPAGDTPQKLFHWDYKCESIFSLSHQQLRSRKSISKQERED